MKTQQAPWEFLRIFVGTVTDLCRNCNGSLGRTWIAFFGTPKPSTQLSQQLAPGATGDRVGSCESHASLTACVSPLSALASRPCGPFSQASALRARYIHTPIPHPGRLVAPSPISRAPTHPQPNTAHPGACPNYTCLPSVTSHAHARMARHGAAPPDSPTLCAPTRLARRERACARARCEGRRSQAQKSHETLRCRQPDEATTQPIT